MCLIVHQPVGASAPAELLESAAAYNPDGFGFMGFDARGRVRVERSRHADWALAKSLALEFEGLDCAFHFRRRTRGSMGAENLHPFELADGLLLMHNGTANVPLRIAGHSDSWHLVNDYLAPLLAHRRKLIYDRAFRRIVDAWLGPQNRLVILDASERRIELLHRAEGHEWRGLWLSNTRWLDQRLLGLGADVQRDVYRADEVSFC